ncbi:hypothetical protein [Micromonospora sp. NPDC005220]|uniref:hypothetical protein n=1 Tax=Micromonospora sp. NPDC005220 TaxID=3155589 RepID=UPI0033A021A1
MTGLLAGIEVKTCWQLAEQAGHARPDAMQRYLPASSTDDKPAATGQTPDLLRRPQLR